MEEEDTSAGVKMLNTLNPYGQIINGVMDIGERVGNWITHSKDREYAKWLQKKIWEREDSLIQRRVADAQLAGINPLAGLGMSGSAQVVSMPDFNPTMSGTGIAQALIGQENLISQQEHEMNVLDIKHTQEMEKLAKEHENAVSQQQIQNAFNSMIAEAERQSKEKLARIQNLREREQFEKNYRKSLAEMRNNQTKWEEEFKHKKTEDKRRFILDCGKAVVDGVTDIWRVITFQKK